MWEISKEFRFEAAHRLENHDGKCRRLHGHSYVGKIHVAGTLQGEGPKTGMVVDYGDLSKILKPMVDDYLDHHFLNETLASPNTTAEFIAAWVFVYLQSQVDALGGRLVGVEISETCTSACVYTRSTFDSE